MMATGKTTKRTVRGGKAQKKNEIRSVKHGNITYSSRPQDNPTCSPRCSPPYRYASLQTGLKTTTVRYRHRNLAITSPDTVPKKRTAKKTASKTTAKKTVKSPAKKKVPAKKTAVKTVKAPTVNKAPAMNTAAGRRAQAIRELEAMTAAHRTARKPAVKKAPAKKTASKTVSCGCAVSPAKQSKPRTVTCGCAQTPAQVKKAILDKAEKEGMNRKELDRHISVVSVVPIQRNPKPYIPQIRTTDGKIIELEGTNRQDYANKAIFEYQEKHSDNEWDWRIFGVQGPDSKWHKYTPAKASFKAPASWKVPAVGGRFEAKAPAKKTASKTASKEVTIRMSAPLSVQKRVLAKKNAMAKAKEVPDLLDPERPRPEPEYIRTFRGLPEKEDPLAKVAFAHIYGQKESERIDIPSNIYHVVELNGKYYVKDGNQIVSLKKDTKREAFDLAIRKAKTYNGRVVAQFKVPKSNPPRYRFKTIG